SVGRPGGLAQAADAKRRAHPVPPQVTEGLVVPSGTKERAPRRPDQAGNGSRPRRERTSGRRSGGTVFGGWRRGGSRSSRSVARDAISRDTARMSSAVAPVGLVT